MIFPCRVLFVIRGGGTQGDKHAHEWKSAFKRVPSLYRKIRTGEKTGGANRRVYGPEDAESALSRKASQFED